MTSTGFHANPSWSFPSNVGATPMPGGFQESFEPEPSRTQSSQSESSAPRQPNSIPRQNRRHWPPRTCRICLETVNPTFHAPSENLPGILQPEPSVTYDSSEPESGRLLRPCKCKGSSKYVHEGCLQSWRHADPSYGSRNYWKCPTCGFKYRMGRMDWGRWISSTTTQLVLTITIFIIALFLMGFVADPVINLYSDPFSVLTAPTKLGSKIEPIMTDDEVPTWTEHFVKGLAATGLLGFVKVLFAAGPWQWLNFRSSGLMGGGHRSGNTGRDRMANISWIVVVLGIVTFLIAVYKGVRLWSRRMLEKAGERVMDVTGDDDDDDDEPQESSTNSSGQL